MKDFLKINFNVKGFPPHKLFIITHMANQMKKCDIHPWDQDGFIPLQSAWQFESNSMGFMLANIVIRNTFSHYKLTALFGSSHCSRVLFHTGVA